MPGDATLPAKVVGLDALVARIPDGASIAIPSDVSGVAMTATRFLLRAGTRGLKLFAIPTSGLQADMLIGAGRVAEIEFSAVSLGEFGAAPRFRDAVIANAIVYRDATCPAMHAAILAGAKGVPFMPLRGVVGSDLVAQRPDWRVVQNPMATEDDPILLVPAIRPGFALFHAPLADRHGNVWVGTRRELITMAQAAQETLVTAERVIDKPLIDDPLRRPGVLHTMYVTAVAAAPRGAWPLALPNHYPADSDEMHSYSRAARDPASFNAYLASLVEADALDAEA